MTFIDQSEAWKILPIGELGKATKETPKRGMEFFLEYLIPNIGAVGYLFSEFTRASERPQNGGKMTVMDLLEFRNINGPDPMPKYGAIWSIGSRGGISPPPRPL